MKGNMCWFGKMLLLQMAKDYIPISFGDGVDKEVFDVDVKTQVAIVRIKDDDNQFRIHVATKDRTYQSEIYMVEILDEKGYELCKLSPQIIKQLDEQWYCCEFLIAGEKARNLQENNLLVIRPDRLPTY